jgi:CheY-like chemotaxis protein
MTKKLVFIVEDHPVQQKMLKVHFEETLGVYTVRTFAHPNEMLSHLHEKPFAIVLDHFFGDHQALTGLDYLKKLKKSNGEIPVIYYTTLNDSKIRDEVKTLGAEDYIIKDSASLVRLRTALDSLHQKQSKKKGLLKKIFGR